VSYADGVLSLPLALLLSAAPVKVAFSGLDAANVQPAEADLAAELLAQGLSRRGLEVLTGKDVAALLGHERQQQLMGCADDSSCLTEVVGALGAQGLVRGSVGKLGQVYTLAVKVLSVQRAKPVALFSGEVDRADDLPALCALAAWELASQLATALDAPQLKPTDPRPGLESGGSRRAWALLPAVVAVGAATTGTLLMLRAGSQFEVLSGATSVPVADAAWRDGKEAQGNATIAFVVAGASAAATVLLFALLGDSDAAPTVALVPGGAVVGLTGVLP